ncbi:hypothetical protein Pmani_025032 [Petrolisthes manimaculis]|uniref:Endonuclease/exonuclease/phosphatase domain-containing protein n=2 Tax=Petrolisthes manimaculis TaxID=1843537 RepID=A0AAE1U1K4_9EUCA|nr:hypothetical protein Pmani_025032 [Petrolisthes manimaculis]
MVIVGVSCVPAAEAGRILFLGPISSKSHKNFYMGIVNALADHGNQCDCCKKWMHYHCTHLPIYMINKLRKTARKFDCVNCCDVDGDWEKEAVEGIEKQKLLLKADKTRTGNEIKQDNAPTPAENQDIPSANQQEFQLGSTPENIDLNCSLGPTSEQVQTPEDNNILTIANPSLPQTSGSNSTQGESSQTPSNNPREPAAQPTDTAGEQNREKLVCLYYKKGPEDSNLHQYIRRNKQSDRAKDTSAKYSTWDGSKPGESFFRLNDRDEVNHGRTDQNSSITRNALVQHSEREQAELSTGRSTPTRPKQPAVPMDGCTNLPLENIIMGNIQGLYPKANQSKVPFLNELAVLEDPIFIALTETHLHSEVNNAEIHIENYSPFRVERDRRKCGGVILYIRDDVSLEAKQMLSISNGQVEIIAVHLTSKNLVVINCYRPPQASKQNFNSAMSGVAKMIEEFPTPTPEIIMCGDFNFPEIKWPEGTLSAGGTLDHQAQAKALLEVADKSLLTQQIITPTRRDNILDLYFTNNQESINTYRTEQNILSDHDLIVINTAYKKNKSERAERNTTGSSPFTELNFFSEEIEWEKLQQSFSEVDWEQTILNEDPNTMLHTLLDKLL